MRVYETEAPHQVSRCLDMEPGAPVIVRSRKFVVEDRPVQMATSYLPAELVRGTAIAQENTGPGGSHARLAELGAEPVRFSEELRARMPSEDERAALGLAPGTPVVESGTSRTDQSSHVVRKGAAHSAAAPTRGEYMPGLQGDSYTARPPGTDKDTCLRRGRSGSRMAGAPFASAGRLVASAGKLPSRLPSTQAEPSRRDPGRQGRSYSGALHLDALNHARSTVCGSTADGVGAGASGG
ncbi:UTRA domain-containing protein [Streptomyces sp. NBC_01334]|nr:UTRA domain-containing protein [Streptomyces sp. NBC_01334]